MFRIPITLRGRLYLAKGDKLRAAGTAGEAAYRRARELLERCIRINEVREEQVRKAYGKPAPGLVGRTKPDAYRLLAGAYERLGDMDAALRAAREGQRLAPQNPEMYNLVADLLVMREQGNEAAVVLTEGMLITADPGLRANLVRLYGSSSDPANCTLMAGPNGPAINPRCQIVVDHACAAAPGVLQALDEIGRRQEAMEKKQTFIREFHCAVGTLNAVP